MVELTNEGIFGGGGFFLHIYIEKGLGGREQMGGSGEVPHIPPLNICILFEYKARGPWGRPSAHDEIRDCGVGGGGGLALVV